METGEYVRERNFLSVEFDISLIQAQALQGMFIVLIELVGKGSMKLSELREMSAIFIDGLADGDEAKEMKLARALSYLIFSRVKKAKEQTC